MLGIDNDDNIWVADSVNGLLKFTNFEYEEIISQLAVEMKYCI